MYIALQKRLRNAVGVSMMPVAPHQGIIALIKAKQIRAKSSRAEQCNAKQINAKQRQTGRQAGSTLV